MSHGLYHKCGLVVCVSRPKDEFQGENELLGLKGWQPCRMKFLTAHDSGTEGEKTAMNAECGAAGLWSMYDNALHFTPLLSF